MFKHRRAGQDVAATLGISQVLQRFRQPHTDLPVRGDGDGQVAERLITRTVGGDPVPGRIPPIPPLIDRQARGVKMMARLGQPGTALHHMDPARGPVRLRSGQHRAQMLDPALLLKPLGLGGIPLRGPGLSPGFPLGHRQRVSGGGAQAFLDRGDRSPQPRNVAVLGITGQPVLIIITGDLDIPQKCGGMDYEE